MLLHLAPNLLWARRKERSPDMRKASHHSCLQMRCPIQARYQKERAANRRNEILLDQLCMDIEVKAVAVRDQQARVL